MADRVGLYAVTDLDYLHFRNKLTGLGVLERILRKPYRLPLRFSESFHVSNHLFARDPSVSMFGDQLRLAIYGGSLIHDYFKHPVFPPRFSDAKAVADLHAAIGMTWRQLKASGHSLTTDPFWTFEIDMLLKAYGHAARTESGLVVITRAYAHGGNSHPRMVYRPTPTGLLPISSASEQASSQP